MAAVGTVLTPEAAMSALESILERNRQFYSDPRGTGALKDLQQTFPNPWLYVAELLQNAIDEKATHIAVSVLEDHTLIFEHDGKPFSLADVEALCARGVSTKGANTVGFMGVGFKSVFRSFEQVCVSSGPWKFRLTVPIWRGEEYGDQQRDWLGAVLPLAELSMDGPSQGMTCRFVLSQRLPDLPSPTEDLSRVLGENKTLLPLLAWQGIKELNWNRKRWLLKREESALDDQGSKVKLESKEVGENGVSQWILFSKSYQPSNKAIARFLEHRQLSPSPDEKEHVYREASRRRLVAVFCEVDSSGVPQPLTRGSAFAMLPTSVSFPVGLHVQADWLLVVTRRDMMQLEGNEWHEEILEQLPVLIRYYLNWLISEKSSVFGWNRGYDALPSSPITNITSDEWFGGDKFVEALRTELKELAFLPSTKGRKVVFVSPELARFLPKALAKTLEDPEFHPDVLFGKRTITNRILGARARRCLDNLQLVKELSPEELAADWKSLVVKRWLDFFPNEAKFRRLMVVLEALSAQDEFSEWKSACLVCLPTASGDWEHRGAISRYPADWNSLAQEDEIRRVLEPVLGPPQTILLWEFDAAIQQGKSPAAAYLNPVARPTLEEVANQWWEKLPESPSENETGLAIRFSAWVLTKQPQRKRLIQKLLCQNDDGNLHLKSNHEALLADPYAGVHRRIFFPFSLPVSAIYETKGPSIARTDWRSFFENLSPAPMGRFHLMLSTTTMSEWELKRYAKGFNPPARRSSWLRRNWGDFTVQSDQYTVVDSSFPEPLDQLLSAVTKLQFLAISQWLNESPTLLTQYSSVLAAYIPYMQSYVSTVRLPIAATWVESLRSTSWVFARGGDGPYLPSDILPSEDPARPNAPVADLSAELIKTLQNCGVEFGSALPDAPAIDRLRIQGPTSSAERLFEHLDAAIREAGEDETKQKLLTKILREQSIFPLPSGSMTIDRATRGAHDRLVWSDRPRSLLGDWLIAIESVPENSGERKVFELAASYLEVPRSASFSQVLDFLSWVWRTTPEADLVRRILPRAYGYIKEDLETDDSLRARWTQKVANASVFVQHKRKWVPVTALDLFFDDLNDAGLEGMLSSVNIVTPGHLGESRLEQVEVAQMLGVKLLSSRFEVKMETADERAVEEVWQSRFREIQNWLRLQLQKDGESDSGQDDGVTPQQDLRLRYWGALRAVIFDSGTRLSESEVRAASLKNGTVAVSGNPADFAEELCKVLFNEWGLRFRRDLVELIPKVAIQLTRIGDSEFKLTLGPQKVAEPLDGAPAKPETQPQQEKETSTAKRGAHSTDVEPAAQKVGTEQAVTEEPPLDEDTSGNNKVTSLGGSYTDDDREARLQAMIAKKKEIEQKIQNALTLEVSPEIDSDSEGTKTGEFRTDDAYRDAALNYEENHGRYPVPKSATQPGHDIDSYTHPVLHPDRKLIRRIEVKGKGLKWDFAEIVEMSDIQFNDALNRKVDSGEPIDSDFDYWLYVVETKENGELHVLPIRNVAKRAARFALKGGSWRHETEQQDFAQDASAGHAGAFAKPADTNP